MSKVSSGKGEPRLLSRLRRGLGEFLEIVGLREPRVPFEERLRLLRFRYVQFREALSANGEILALISEVEERLDGGRPTSPAAAKALAVQALAAAGRMVRALNALSENRYPSLEEALRRIERRFSACFAAPDPPAARERILPLEKVDAALAPWVGHKMANLGEIQNRLGLPVPPGFVVTVRGFREVAAGLPGGEAWLHLPPAATDAEREEAAERAREALRSASLPEVLERDLLEAYDALARRCGGPVPVAVRSSALLEDSELSFAGQFETVLHVRREDLGRAYLRVLASLYEPRGVSYRGAFKVDERELEVAVGVMAMVPAACGGVGYSRDPLDPAGEEILLHATPGLGASLVEGRASPSVLEVNRKTLEVRRAPESPASCLSEGEAAELARYILRLEEHFGFPQDVEWALDEERRPFLLQARPLLFSAPAPPPAPLPPGASLLFEGGETACPGAGAGPVVLVDDRSDLSDFPKGAVLVAAHSSPSYVPALRKAAAVVTEVGSVLGHMASVAREIGVPALLGVKGVLGLPAGRVVTVDAGGRRVLDGRVEGLLQERPKPPQRPAGAGLRLLREIHPYLVPLTLTDPRSPNFTPLACHSLHDVARYAHERLFQEMFGVGRLVGDARREAPLLDVFLPMDLYILDLGGGLSAAPGSRKVKRSEVASPLLLALLDGMLHPEIPRYGPRALDAGGFLHVVLRQGLAGPENEPSLRDPCYAIVSDRYLNLAARVGYHFSAVDAYAGAFLDDNYITFRFKGGAADRDRRERRVKAIARILDALGFSVTIANDLVDAHFKKRPREEILRTLDLLGRLLQFMRQMDAAMASDAWVDPVAEAFLRGDYGLKGLGARPEPPP